MHFKEYSRSLSNGDYSAWIGSTELYSVGFLDYSLTVFPFELFMPVRLNIDIKLVWATLSLQGPKLTCK